MFFRTPLKASISMGTQVIFLPRTSDCDWKQLRLGPLLTAYVLGFD